MVQNKKVKNNSKNIKPKKTNKPKKQTKQTMKNGNGLAKVKALSQEVNKIGKPEPLKASPWSLLSMFK